MENSGYLLAAYSVVWAIVFGYVFVLSRRQRQLKRDIDSLKQKIGDNGEGVKKS